jgi:hypothetical protein
MTRRDKCHKVATRAAALTARQRSRAWKHLVGDLFDLGEIDIPRFRHLLESIYRSTIRVEIESRPKP